jgi:hypothetical protein
MGNAESYAFLKLSVGSPIFTALLANVFLLGFCLSLVAGSHAQLLFMLSAVSAVVTLVLLIFPVRELGVGTKVMALLLLIVPPLFIIPAF